MLKNKKSWNPWKQNKSKRTSVYCKCVIRIPSIVDSNFCAKCFKLLKK